MGYSGQFSVIIVRKIEANAAKVWQAWTDPSMVTGWFGSDPEGKGLAASMDIRTGGKFEVIFMDSDGTTHTCSGIYKVIDEPSKLIFSWNWKNEPGIYSQVRVSLKPDGDQTHMHFEHSGLHSGSQHDYRQGWQRTFDKLDRLLKGDK